MEVLQSQPAEANYGDVGVDVTGSREHDSSGGNPRCESGKRPCIYWKLQCCRQPVSQLAIAPLHAHQQIWPPRSALSVLQPPGTQPIHSEPHHLSTSQLDHS